MITPRTIFRIIYGASYTILYTLLIILLLVSPGDAVYQSFRYKQRNNIWIVTVVYFITVGIIVFVYVTRLYINKTALSAIPKLWIPIDKNDVKQPVWKIINSCLSRSAAIGFVSRPRSKRELVHCCGTTDYNAPIALVPTRDSDDEQPQSRSGIQRTRTGSLGAGISRTVFEIPASATAIWDDIEHPGWSSPNAPEMPDVQYSVVCSEIPGMIEARALLLAPIDVTIDSPQSIPHPDAIQILHRLPNMSLRDYLSHLALYNVLPHSQIVADFLAHYERSKYSSSPLPGAEFREMMAQFAQLLQAMTPLNLTVLDHESFFEDGDDGHESFHSSFESSTPRDNSNDFRYMDAVDDENPSTVPSTHSPSSPNSSLKPERVNRLPHPSQQPTLYGDQDLLHG